MKTRNVTLLLLFALLIALCPRTGMAADQKVTQPAVQAGAEKAASKASSAVAPAITNINTATADELAKLPGIGPKIAGDIVKYRTDNGAFKSKHDIVNVKGVGEKKFQSIKDKITVGQEEDTGAATEQVEKAAKGKAKKEMAQ
jgi:competence protein ComEA